MANKLYEEASVQVIADALRLKRDGSANTYTIADMNDGVLSLPFGNIPSYHYAEVGRAIKKILDLKALYPNNICLGTISDNHVDMTNENAMKSARHAVFALENVGALAQCDFVVNLGDNCSGANIDNDIDLANITYMENSIRYVLTLLESFNLIGNHEKSNSTQKLFDLIGKYNSFDDYGLTQIRGYGYKDFTDKKVRVIVLNTCDYWNGQGGNGMSYEQKDFFMRALDLSSKEDFSEWVTIVLSHIPLDFLGGDYNKGADLKSILKAYNDGSSVSITVDSSYASAQNETPSSYATYSDGALVYDYSGKNTPKVVNIHGHIHTNAYGKLIFIDDNTELDIMRVATPNSSFNDNASTDRYTDYGNYSITTEEASKIAKVADTKADTSATFYFFDLDGEIIYSIGYGADIDRIIPYKDATLYTVSYNLGDATIDDSSIYAVEGEPFTRTLSVPTNYEITSIVITMGGVDITSTAYSNGVITIEEVTGNIAITVVTKDNYVPVWDIGSRTAITNVYKGSNDTLALSRHNYYWGAFSESVIHYRKISSCSVSGNDVTFTPIEDKNAGIGLPYHLEAGASYTFSATASVKARLRWCVMNADGTHGNDGGYSSSGTDLSVTFTAPDDESMWVMLILGGYTVDQEVTFTNVALTKN